MLISQVKYLCLLFLFSLLLACAPVENSQKVNIPANKVRFVAENFHEIPVSPFYLPDPAEDRKDHAYALTVISASGKPFFGFLKPNLMLINPLFDFITGLEMKGGLLSKGTKTLSADDNCRGNLNVEATFQTDGSFNGVILYSDYSDNCSLVFDTSVPFKGQIDPVTGQLTAELRPHDLLARYDSREIRINGKIELTMNVFTGPRQKYSARVNMTLDEATGQKYRLDELLLNWDETGQYSLFSLAGGIHFSKYGRVDMITDGFLVSQKKNDRPFDGFMKFLGADDAWLQLRFPNFNFPGSFRIENQNGTMRTMGNF